MDRGVGVALCLANCIIVGEVVLSAMLAAPRSSSPISILPDDYSTQARVGIAYLLISGFFAASLGIACGVTCIVSGVESAIMARRDAVPFHNNGTIPLVAVRVGASTAAESTPLLRDSATQNLGINP